MFTRRPAVHRAIRMMLTVVMTGTLTGVVPALAQEANDDKTISMFGRFVEMGKAELKRLADTTPDAPDLAAQLDYDAEKIFAYVRDRVKTEPYAGVLRGGRGALLAHAGNAADKSLLLKTMLEAGGLQTRLVTAKLPADRADALVAQFLKADPLSGPLGEQTQRGDIDKQLADFCKQSGIDEKIMAEQLAKVEKQTAAMQADALKQTDDATAFLKSQLAANNVKIGKSAADWATELAGRVRNHVWVQYQDAAGKWVDADAAFTDAKLGQSPAGAGDVVTGDLPDRFVVQMSLIYATTDGKKEEQILSVPLNADEALFRPADFIISPVDGLPPIPELLTMPAEERVKALAKVEKFQAVIRSGARKFASKAFDLKGRLFDVGGDGRIAGAKDVGAAAGGVFGGFGGGDGPAKASDSFKSLSMEFAFITPPGQPKIPTQRRVIISADQLKGSHVVSPILDWQILIQPQAISTTYGAAGTLKNRIDMLEPVLELIKKNNSADTNATNNSIDKLLRDPPEPFPSFLIEWTIFRQMDLARSLKQNPDVAVLWDAPQVVVAERRFCMNKNNGHMCDRSQTDIVHNGLTVIPRKADADAAQVALRQGVYDTVAEGVMLTAAVPDGIQTSSATALDEVRTKGGKLGAFAAADIAQSPLSESDKAFVAAAESNRHVLTAAGENGKPATAWWSVDPATGSVVGRSTGGFGQAISEEAMLQQLAGLIACLMGVHKDASTNDDSPKAQKVTLLGVGVCAVGGVTGITSLLLGGGGASLIFWINFAIGVGLTIYK